MNRLKRLSLLVAPLLIATLACSATDIGPSTVATPVVITVVVPATGAPNTEAAATQAPEPTEPAQPVANATAISVPGPVVTYNNISLNLDINLARGVGARLVPASEFDPNLPPFALNPEYTEFTLDGYPVVQHYQKPIISVYKLDEILKMTPDLAPEVDQFKALLQSQDLNPDQFPTIPITNAGQIFHAQVRYLNFANGQGVRFITQYAQAVGALNNEDAFYLFEGLSADGVYFVRAQLPINSTSLGFSFDDFGGATVDLSSSDAGAQYEAYLANTIATLNALPPDQFSPNLESLDNLIASLTIK